jgi:perosamine synthetase
MMWVRKRLDIDWQDFLAGVFRCVVVSGPDQTARRIETLWAAEGNAVACLSVRSGFDLLLSALALSRGSEVLVSAMTIPDMVQIIQHHGLTPVPLDVDMHQLAPSSETLLRAITPATRAVLLAHLFGSRMKLDRLATIAKAQGLYVIEDCAQAFHGSSYTGHRLADASLFSFGPIKTATALGGALLRIDDPQIVATIREQHARLPRQTRSAFFHRLLKYSAIKAAGSSVAYAAVVRGLRAIGVDHDRLVNGLVRGFPGPGLIDRIRRRPSAPLLALLERRLRAFDSQRLHDRCERGRLLVRLIGGAIDCPGGELPGHTYWVFPILVDDPERIISALLQEGFDATQGQSLGVVPAPAGRPELEASNARMALRQMVFVPLDRRMPLSEVNRLAEILLRMACPQSGAVIRKG